MFCNMIRDGMGYSFGVLMPTLMSYYGCGQSYVAVVGSVMGGTYQLVGPAVASAIHKFGMR